MVAGDSLAGAKPSKSMVNEENNGSANSCRLTVSTQACYGARPRPSHLLNSSGASSATTYAYMWGNQGLALTISDAEGKISHEKDNDLMGKCKGSSVNVKFVFGRSGKSGKKARSCGDDCASQSGSEGLSNEDDDKASKDEFPGMKKRSLDQIFADGANAQRVSSANHQVWNSGDLLVSKPSCKLNRGSREVDASKKLLQRKEKKGLHEKSERRLRICIEKELHAKVEALSRETSELTADLKMHSQSCMKLSEENSSLLNELKQIYGPEVISMLEAKNPNRDSKSTNAQSCCHDQELPSEKSSSPVQSTDT